MDERFHYRRHKILIAKITLILTLSNQCLCYIVRNLNISGSSSLTFGDIRFSKCTYVYSINTSVTTEIEISLDLQVGETSHFFSSGNVTNFQRKDVHVPQIFHQILNHRFHEKSRYYIYQGNKTTHVFERLS